MRQKKKDKLSLGKSHKKKVKDITFILFTVGEEVKMFGAEKNNLSNNFGNPLTIAISYDLQGYYGGGTNGYAALLERTISTPFICGKMRIETDNPLLLSQSITVTDNDPTGKQVQAAIVQFTKLNQFNQIAIETDTNFAIYGGTELSYLAATTGVVRWYFWPASVASMTRAIEGKAVFKPLRRPDTLLVSMINLKNSITKKPVVDRLSKKQMEQAIEKELAIKKELMSNAEGLEEEFEFDKVWGEENFEEAAGDNNQYTSNKIKKPESEPYVYTVTVN